MPTLITLKSFLLEMTQTALITGATSGIGLEIARILAATHHLVLVSRDKKKLEELKSSLRTTVHTFAIDLSTVGSARKVFDYVRKRRITVDVLVNNAGFGVSGESVGADVVKTYSMLHLNIITLTELCMLFGKEMKERKRGFILNVASVAAYQPVPYLASYSASKSYVLNFSEALAQELSDYNVHVTCLCPGVTSSNFYAAMGRTARGASARDVALFGVRALFGRRMTVTFGLRNNIRVWLVRLLPRVVVARLAKRLMRGFG